MWQIQDENGVIHSGTEEDMRWVFDVMSNPANYDDSVWEKYCRDAVTGDLQLVHVIATI